MKTICGSSLFWLPAGGRDGGNGELRNEETGGTIITKWNATIIIMAVIIIIIVMDIVSIIVTFRSTDPPTHILFDTCLHQRADEASLVQA